MANGTWGGALDRHPMAVRITWTDDVHVLQTGFHLRSAGANVTAPEEVATEVMDWVNTHFRTMLAIGQRVMGVDVVDLVSKEGHQISPGNMLGTRNIPATSTVPSALAVVVSMKTSLRARYGQARMFWPILSDTDFDGDSLSVTGRGVMQPIADALAEKFIGNSINGHNLIGVHGLLPPKAATPSRPARPEIPPSWYDIGSLRVNNAVTFLRSRKAGVGS